MKMKSLFIQHILFYQVLFVLMQMNSLSAMAPGPFFVSSGGASTGLWETAKSYFWAKAPNDSVVPPNEGNARPVAPEPPAAHIPNPQSTQARIAYGAVQGLLVSPSLQQKVETIADNVIAATDRLNNPLGNSNEARQVQERITADFVKIVGRPGNKGGVRGVVEEFTDMAADRIALKVQEGIIDPALKKVEEKIEKLKPDMATFKTESSDFLKKTLLVGIGVIGCYYTFRFIANRLERYVNRPRIEFTLAKAITGEGNVDKNRKSLKEMVFASDVKDRLNTILLNTSTIKRMIQDGDDKVKYGNLLLYGPLGSGKRMFAQHIAHFARMDFYEISGATLAGMKDSDAALAIEDFLKRESLKATRGAIIYIDNASMLLTQRKYGLINAFIEQGGKRSNKYMLVLGTHSKPKLPGEMAVINDIIEIKRPALNERITLLQLFRDKLFSTNGIDETLAESARENLHDNIMQEIAQKLNYASSAGICEFMEKVYLEAQHEGAVTPALVDSIVDRTVQKYQDLIRN